MVEQKSCILGVGEKELGSGSADGPLWLSWGCYNNAGAGVMGTRELMAKAGRILHLKIQLVGLADELYARCERKSRLKNDSRISRSNHGKEVVIVTRDGKKKIYYKQHIYI